MKTPEKVEEHLEGWFSDLHLNKTMPVVDEILAHCVVFDLVEMWSECGSKFPVFNFCRQLNEFRLLS